MRHARILFGLILLVATHGVSAQQAVQSSSLDEPCSVPADSHWTAQEKFVWQRVCLGKVANFNEEPGYEGEGGAVKLDPLKPDGWPQNRILRPAFLQAILLEDSYRRALTWRGVDVVGARFTEPIDLAGAELQHPLRLRASLLEKGADLGGLKSRHAISLVGSKVAGLLKMYELDLDANLNLELNEAEFADVQLGSARVGGILNLSSSKVTGMLDMNGLQARALFMRNKAEFANVGLGSAHVGGQLALNGSKVTGKLNMNGLQVDNVLADNAEFAEVVLVAAHVGRQLSLIGSKVTGKLDMDSLRVDGSLLMREEAGFAAVNLDNAHVGGQLQLIGSKVTGQLDCYSLEVEQQAAMENTEFGGPVNCRNAKIRGNLNLSGGRFQNDVDLLGGDIGGELGLAAAQWSEGATLVLRNARVATIPALTEGWAPWLDLDGFTYRSVGAADGYESWFRRKLGPYVPQPYDQLASVVERQGQGTLATAIRYSGHERERAEARGARWAWLTALKWVIGYGHYPHWAIFWAIGLVAVGAIVLRVSGEGPRNGMPIGLAYSFDMLLPIIRLRDRHYRIDLTTGARYYFYWHKIMGFVLASFLIAGLSGLTR